MQYLWNTQIQEMSRMGVMDNIRGIREAMDIRSKESRIGRDALNVSTVEAKFLNEYGSFKLGLMDILEKTIFIDGNRSIELKGKTTDANKLLKHTMTDDEITLAFNIEITASGNFRYTLGDSIEELIEKEAEKEQQGTQEEDKDDNIIYI